MSGVHSFPVRSISKDMSRAHAGESAKTAQKTMAPVSVIELCVNRSCKCRREGEWTINERFFRAISPMCTGLCYATKQKSLATWNVAGPCTQVSLASMVRLRNEWERQRSDDNESIPMSPTRFPQKAKRSWCNETPSPNLHKWETPNHVNGKHT